YIKEHLEEIRFRVRKGEKSKYQEAAAAMGLSVAKFFLLAADKLIEEQELPFDYSENQ
ncbi:MAG: type II toxin-antitoxin system RelB/DinJ family antitoxin, partial [Clostridia bacterium]|nr:type II toxin-antitoxin system RelB/DinJ family antitoxin [Clostridia bacterium]